MRHRSQNWIWGLVLIFCAGLWTDRAAASEVTLWSRGNLGYLTEGVSMPLWPQLPGDALPLNKPLIMTLTMPKGFEVVGYDTSHDFAVGPIPVIEPTKIDSFTTGDQVTYRIYLPDPPNSGAVRPALLINPGSNAAGSYSIRMGLQTTDAQKVWANTQATLEVLPRLQGQAPKRLKLGIYDYADYDNPTYRTAIADAIRSSGMNTVANMRYYSSSDTIAQQLRNDGVQSGLVWFWDAHTAAVLATHPEARTLNAAGVPVSSSLSYTWCIQNKQLATTLFADYIRNKTATCKFDTIINDNEERAFVDGQVYGDLYTPATLSLFRTRAAIPANVTLTPEVIASTYSRQWVDFRCWQSAEMSKILADAVKSVDPNISYGIYSGYNSTDTKERYSLDWNLIGQQANLDFGTAGYYGGTGALASTANALNGKPFIPSEMFVENFLDHTTAMPGPDNFAYRLMKSTLYSGGKGGVMIWYGQVLDAAGFSAAAKVSSVLAKIEDPLIDGARRGSDLDKYTTFSDGDLFVYQMGTKRVLVAFNHSDSAKNVNFKWNKSVHGSTRELLSGTVMQDPASLIGSIAPHSFAVFVTGEESKIDTFNSYAAGNLEEVGGSAWVKTGINKFQVKPGAQENNTLRMGPWYWGDGAYYSIESERAGSDYTAGVDFAAAPDWGGIDDDGTWGIFARQQDNGDSVYARVYVDTNRNGTTAPTSATLYLNVNGESYRWASNVPIDYLESNKGHIELTLDGASAHAEAFWGESYFKTLDFIVGGELLNAGPAGIYGFEHVGNYYYCVVDLDNFSILPKHIPGDANGDGVVDVGDLGILAGNYGLTSGADWSHGDFNGDGMVDVGDLGILAGNYGSGAAVGTTVPEPVSVVLITLGGLGLLRKR